MKKTLAVISALVCFAVLAARDSYASEPTTPTIETLSSTMSTVGLAISSQVPTEVVVSTKAGYRYVVVQNLDSTANLYCSENVAVSTITTRSSVGIKVVPNNIVYFSIVPSNSGTYVGSQYFYCLNDGASASTRAVIMRGR